jgi:phage repressor protein C with HTH and peptisase S24 domain
MAPALASGQLVLASAWLGAPREGDLVIIRHQGLEKIKRVARTKPKRIYVLGDNASSSTDSRDFGWLDTANVTAKVWWPKR